ncbi:MAG TPA: translation initiation factor [Planctomycetota bacterium]|nr:translation initiation factor [Planctomycetota bacterium]
MEPSPKKLYPEILKLRREKRPGGREVVVIEGFNPGTQIKLDELAGELKRSCGTGGTVKGRTIEIQGDHRDRIAEVLLSRGFRSKRAGG